MYHATLLLMSLEISPVLCNIKPFAFAASQEARQEVDITLARKQGRKLKLVLHCDQMRRVVPRGVGWLTAEDNVLDKYICPPFLELCDALYFIQ